MTINSTTRKAGPFAGTGLQTAYPFAFKVFTASDMLVVQTNSLGVDATLVLGTDYSVVLNADQNANPGGTINMVVAPPVGFLLTLGSVVPATQGQSIPNNGGFFPKVIEDAFDKLTIEVQQLAEKIARTLQYAFSDSASGGTMPSAAARANNLLGFDSTGNIVAVAPTSGSATALQVLLATPAGAGLIGNNPAGNIAATNVQSALNELDAEKVSLAGPDTISGAKTFTVSPILPALLVGDTSLVAAPAKLVADSIVANLPRGHIAGLTMSTAGASTTMTIAAGQAANSTNAILLNLAASISKTTAAWAVGSAVGGLDTGAIANNTWYHWYLIRRPDTGVVDVVYSLSSAAPTLPANYTQYRRIGSRRTNGSAQWVSFTQIYETFFEGASILDVNTASVGTTAAVLTSLSVPTGFSVEALITGSNGQSGAATNQYLRFSSPLEPDEAPSISVAPLFDLFGGNLGNAIFAVPMRIMTDTSGRIRYRSFTTNSGIQVVTHGYVDRRGKDL